MAMMIEPAASVMITRAPVVKSKLNLHQDMQMLHTDHEKLYSLI